MTKEASEVWQKEIKGIGYHESLSKDEQLRVKKKIEKGKS
jgi:hypothetical protein